uniref:Uncharacterized protein n=1 Tax=Ciona savignyi TaxID=51511 RepID=H2YDW5_CIOSA
MEHESEGDYPFDPQFQDEYLMNPEFNGEFPAQPHFQGGPRGPRGLLRPPRPHLRGGVRGMRPHFRMRSSGQFGGRPSRPALLETPAMDAPPRIPVQDPTKPRFLRPAIIQPRTTPRNMNPRGIIRMRPPFRPRNPRPQF